MVETSEGLAENENLFFKITDAIESDNYESKRIELDDSRSAINYILREKNKGTIYMGSQTDEYFYIVSTETGDDGEEFKVQKEALPNTQSQAAALMKDDTLLFVGCIDSTVKTYSIRKDPSKPNIGHEF